MFKRYVFVEGLSSLFENGGYGLDNILCYAKDKSDKQSYATMAGTVMPDWHCDEAKHIPG